MEGAFASLLMLLMLIVLISRLLAITPHGRFLYVYDGSSLSVCGMRRIGARHAREWRLNSRMAGPRAPCAPGLRVRAYKLLMIWRRLGYCATTLRCAHSENCRRRALIPDR